LLNHTKFFFTHYASQSAVKKKGIDFFLQRPVTSKMTSHSFQPYLRPSQVHHSSKSNTSKSQQNKYEKQINRSHPCPWFLNRLIKKYYNRVKTRLRPIKSLPAATILKSSRTSRGNITPGAATPRRFTSEKKNTLADFFPSPPPQ
jgi:hypothetical protein